MTPDKRLDMATHRLIASIKQHPQLKKPAVDFAKEIEGILADYSMEALHLHHKIAYLIKCEKVLIDIMQGYGIDIQQALGQSDYQIYSHIELGKKGLYKIPEKLKPYVEQNH